METRFLTKKYYPSFDKLRTWIIISFLKKIENENEGGVEIILTKPGGLELDVMT
jgi:hypothetical protein